MIKPLVPPETNGAFYWPPLVILGRFSLLLMPGVFMLSVRIGRRWVGVDWSFGHKPFIYRDDPEGSIEVLWPKSKRNWFIEELERQKCL